MYGQRIAPMLSKNRLGLSLSLLLLTFSFSCKAPPPSPETKALLSQLESTGDLIVAKKIKEKIPLDPSSELWKEANGKDIVLISQTFIIPRSNVFTKKALTVKALYNKKELGLLLSWNDSTKNDMVESVQLFQDAVAVEFPIRYGEGEALPYIGMGNKGRPVNVWQWNAAWQKDLAKGFQTVEGNNPQMVPNTDPIKYLTGEMAGSPLSQEKRKSSVANLVAEGFGTLTSSPSATLNGQGVWKDGAWHVVITRSRKASGTSVPLSKDMGGLVPISFAVWNGAGQERNGIKEITRWRFLQFEGENISLAWLKALTADSLPNGDTARGKQLVTQLGCVQCHNLPGAAAVKDVGPDLVHAGAIHRADYLLESIEDPNAVVVAAPGYYEASTWTSTMPSYEGALKKKDYVDMAKYLGTLQ